MSKKYKIEIGGKELEIEIKNLAERANGEVMARYGDTLVLATCVMSEQEPSLGFFPLTVNYEERYYAAGKILGPRYIKREGRPSDNAVIISRLIDRAIRPRFPEELKREVQVIVTCLSWDAENDPGVLSLIAASLALSISDIPWQGPIGAVRMGFKDRKFFINPSYEERKGSSLEIVFAGPKKDNEVLINMIEGEGEEVEEESILKAYDLARAEIKKLIEIQEKVQKEIGKEKVLIKVVEEPELEKEIKRFLGKKLEEIFDQAEGEKDEKLNELKRELLTFIEEKYPGKKDYASDFFEKKEKELIQQKILKEEKRIDARKLDEIRKISAEVDLIPRTHGSGLFCRGLTKSLSILTLGGPSDQQLIEGMEVRAKKRFLHHYNFPPYSVGEVRALRAPSRRDISHGMLVERALFPLIPEFDDFPYTMRTVSEIISSNGSTSMAAVSSSCLALMDAGVPIKRIAAGIAMGLIKQGDNYKLLTDIQGLEDFHGQMDFKIAGTRKGITGLQMDLKIDGIPGQILKEALEKGKKARLQIIDLMEKVLAKPREKLSVFAPKILSLQIDPEKIGEVIGPKGHTIKRITEETGAAIDIQDTGLIFVTAETEAAAKKAIAQIKNITREIRSGDVFEGRVKKILPLGAIVEIGPNQTGLLHKTKLREKFSKLKTGDRLRVKVIGIDEQGRINFGLLR